MNLSGLAIRKGLEPSTSCVTGRRSNQLNYRTSSDKKDTHICHYNQGFLHHFKRVIPQAPFDRFPYFRTHLWET